MTPGTEIAGLVGRYLKESYYEFTVARANSQLHWQITKMVASTSTVLDEGTFLPQHPLACDYGSRVSAST